MRLRRIDPNFLRLVELGAKDMVPQQAIKDIKYLLKWSGWHAKDYNKRAQAALKELGVDEK